MNFTRTHQYAETSDCGRYSVACAVVNGCYQFQAWRIADKTILHTGDAEDCRQACRKDAQAVEHHENGDGV